MHKLDNIENEFIEREYISIGRAARLCDYSKRYFRIKIIEKNLPLYGFDQNRIAVTDLRILMKNPNFFLRQKKGGKTGTSAKVVV